MDEIAIRAESLSKRFRIGSGRPRVATYGEATGDEIWALRDVSFDVRRGEVLGIIGRNGAGKSTLLKVLARITEPTSGRAEIRGRVASLLEVGTGFHPELSGRENIYLNGAILGMRRAEIRARFDEIVAFSEVERFLDTPVKRYSSGMRVRLAFAVAAHLDPEILIIDEVLAVGDASFQRRCLGAMNDAAGSGRTVLFVSHNMSAVGALCDRAIAIESGRLRASGPTDEVIAWYMERVGARADIALDERRDRGGSGALRYTRVRIFADEDRGAASQPVTGRPFGVSLGYRAKSDAPLRNARFAMVVLDAQGQRVFACDTRLLNADFEQLPSSGEVTCEVPALPLASGSYHLSLWAALGDEVADRVEVAANFSVAEGNPFGTGRTTIAQKHGPVVVGHHWRFAGEAR